MANQIERLDQGSQILQNVDLTSIITGMALGVADAQEKLDENSIRQLTALAEKEVAGKSLLELGFVPAFYAFDFVDISASINLKMAVAEEASFEISAYLDYEKNTNFDKEFFKNVKTLDQKSMSKYSEKSYDRSVKASRQATIKVNTESTIVHNEKGSFRMVEKAQQELMNESENTRCEVAIIDETTIENKSTDQVKIYRSPDGYIVISIPEYATVYRAYLKLTNNYSPTTPDPIKLNSSVSFDKKNNFGDSLTNAKAANDNGGVEKVTGITTDKIIHDNGTETKLKYYFKFGDDSMDDTYCNTINNGNNLQLSSLKFIAQLLKNVGGFNIKVIGYTDKSGSLDYNQDLSERRAKTIYNFLINEIGDATFDNTRIQLEFKGETEAVGSGNAPNAIDRLVEIIFPPEFDFMYFEGGNIDGDATDDTDDDDIFTLMPALQNVPTPTIKFLYGGKQIELNNITTLNYQGTNNYVLEKDFYIEKHTNNLYYLLNKESEIIYTLYNLENKDIDILVNGKRDKETDKSTSKTFSRDRNKAKDKLSQSDREIDGNKTFAVGGSVDIRASRQFSMSMEGNASVSARLVSMPIPEKLKQHINTVYGIDNNNTNQNNSTQ